MSKITDTFSANSLKLLDKSVDEYNDKYVYNLSIYKKDARAVLGQKFHSLICFYIKGFDISKLLLDLNKTELSYWKKLEEILKPKKNNFIKTEYSFLVKNKFAKKAYYLTGRFDAIYQEKDEITIYDWKTLNLPKNAEDDMQTIVYLYCASVIFKTNKIKLRYLSIEKLDYLDIALNDIQKYKERIESIIKKLPEYN